MSTIGLIMSPYCPDNSLTDALFGKVRCAVLALLYTRPDETFYLRQIARVTGMSHGTVHRELGGLVATGLVTRSTKGRQIYYHANQASPVFRELQGLLVKTAGVGDILRSALAPLEPKITAAFAYGSFARGEQRQTSDVDVMVVGDVSFGEVVDALADAQKRLNREVSPTVFTEAEFARRLADSERFVTSVVRDSKIMLIGDEVGLRAVA